MAELDKSPEMPWRKRTIPAFSPSVCSQLTGANRGTPQMNLQHREYTDSHYQHTLSDALTFVGRGLHSDIHVVMRMLPAEPNSGIVFARRDVAPYRSEIPALWLVVDKIVIPRFLQYLIHRKVIITVPKNIQFCTIVHLPILHRISLSFELRINNSLVVPPRNLQLSNRLKWL